MSLLNNIKINNLIKDVNDLQEQITAIITTGTSTITAELDMNNNSIIEVTSLQLGANHTVTLQPYEGNDQLLDISAGVNVGGDILLNNNDVRNIKTISFYGNTDQLNLNSNDNLQFGNNQILTTPLQSDLDMSGNKITDLPTPTTNSEPVTLGYFNQNIPSITNLIENPLTENLDADNNSLLNIQSLSLVDVLQPANKYYANIFNGSFMNTNIDNGNDRLHIIATNEGGPAFPYNTDFRSLPITNLSQLGFNDGGVISKANNTFQFNQPLDLNNNYLKDVHNIQFYNSGTLTTDTSDNLEYNNNVVITTDNIAQYIQEHNWTGEAESDLHMNTFNINNVNNIQLQQASAITLNDNDDICYNSKKLLFQNKI